MRIIHVTQFLGIGGLEKIIFHLAHEQQRLGHKVDIFVYDYERTWVDYFRQSGLNVITPNFKKAGYDFDLLKEMSKLFDSADIIHSHDLNPLMYLGPIRFFRKWTFRNGPKLILSTHGLDHIDTYPRAKLYQHIFSRLADQVVGVSEKVGKFYLDEIKLSPKKVTIIPNGISIFNGEIDEKLRMEKKRWIASRHNLNTDRPIILSLSRIVPLKDQKFLMNIFKLRPNYQLIIAGPAGDQQYYDELKLLEDKNIKLIGAQEQVVDYNLGSDLYVSASTHEGIPVAVLEAMAVETPCLISEIPGHMILLNHGSFVETFPLNQKEDFLQKLDQLFDSQLTTKKNAKLARTIVEKYFSVATMVQHYFTVYAK